MIDPAQIYAQALDAATRRDWPRARSLANDVLRVSPEQGGMHYVAGVANMELGQVPHAVEHLRLATRLDPQRANFAAMYARALALAQLPALEEAERAMSLSPRDPSQLMMLGMVFSQYEAHEQAAHAFRRATELMPNYVPCRFALSSSLIFLGEVAQAEQELDRCLAQDPTFWKAYLSRSLLRRQRASDNHVDELLALLAQDGNEISSPAAQVFLHMAVAKELEDLGRYDEAFPHLVSGKAAGRPQGYTSEADAEIFAAMRDAFSAKLEHSSKATSRTPIFVIGMPRSGTTLVERILSSHPDVHSSGELMSFPLTFKRLSGSHTRRLLDVDTIAHSHTIDWAQAGADYLTHARPSAGDMPYFVDKLPHNFLYVGAIARALPQARIICLRRDPLDTCVSNLRQLFGEDSSFHEYSYDLLDIGRHYVQFDRLMAYWQHQLPGRVLEVSYETLIAEQEATTRLLLDHCELPWNDACLQFEKNEAPVSTASALQVRQPLNRSSIGYWRHYEGSMAPLRQLLTDAGISIAS